MSVRIKISNPATRKVPNSGVCEFCGILLTPEEVEICERICTICADLEAGLGVVEDEDGGLRPLDFDNE